MQFILKVQSIGGTQLSDSLTNTNSLTHEFITHDDEYLKKRGRLYLVLNISASPKFDLKAASKLFVDDIQENYFRLSDETPLHAIERTLNKAYKSLLSLKSKDETMTLGSMESEFKCSFATALVWNSVLYTSYFGNSAIYLIRGTGVRDLSTQDTNSEVWTNSSILADNDVILIGTETFAQEFPPKNVNDNLGNLSHVISTHPEGSNIAVVLIKVNSELVKKTKKISNKLSALAIKNTISQTMWKAKTKISASESLSDKFKPYQSKKAAPVSSISGISASVAAPSNSISKTKPKRISKITKSGKRWKALAIGIFILGGVTYLNYQLFYRSHDDSPKTQTESDYVNTQSQIQGVEDTAPLHPTFVNLNHISENFDFIDMDTTGSISDELLYLISPTSVHTLNTDTKEPSVLIDNVEKGEHISCTQVLDKNLCYVYGNKSLHVTNPKTPDKTDKYFIETDGILDIASYESSVYFLTQNQIYKLKLGEDTPGAWFDENTSLENATSFTIDGNVYVISGRNIDKYKDGKKNAAFEIDNSHLLKPIQIEVGDNNLYVLDSLPGNEKSIVVYNKNTGDFVEKIIIAERNDLETITNFAILNENPEKIVFHKGNHLYVIEKGTP